MWLVVYRADHYLGAFFCTSYITLPSLAVPARNSNAARHQQPGTPPSHLAHQWLYVYDRGKFVLPSIAVASSLLHSYVAYAVRTQNNGRPLSSRYLAAATLVIMVLPYTVLFILPINNKLMAHAKRDDGIGQDKGKEGVAIGVEEEARRKKQDDELPTLLEKWSQRNYGRALLPLLGGVLGASISLGFF